MQPPSATSQRRLQRRQHLFRQLPDQYCTILSTLTQLLHNIQQPILLHYHSLVLMTISDHAEQLEEVEPHYRLRSCIGRETVKDSFEKGR